MDIKIGVIHAPREINVTSDARIEDVVAALEEATAKGSLFRLEDNKGRLVVVPADKVAYLDFGATETRPVGFGAVGA